MRFGESIKNLAEAFAKAQGEFKTVVKDRENPFFHSNYATLKANVEMIRSILPRHGLSYSQGLEIVEGEKMMATIILHESGEWLLSYSPFYTNPTVEKHEGQVVREWVKPQDGGSGMSYSRRYGLAAAFGIVNADDDDDDGNRANGNKITNARPSSSPKVADFAF